MESILPSLPEIAARWGISLSRCRPDLGIAGSPARALQREVLESTDGELYVVEQLPFTRQPEREAQARILRDLAKAGLEPIALWLATLDGEVGLRHDGYYWQLRHWLPGEPLPRETYGDDVWRGDLLAQFLLRLRDAADAAPLDTSAPPFLLHHYIHRLLPHIQERIPALLTDLNPILQQLHPFLEEESSLPLRFCHGDFHPGNVLWGSQCIYGVIDWEFLGRKSAAYDLANLLGCLGVDNPDFLTGPLALAAIHVLHDHEYLTPQGWHALPCLVAALRFAWLREWVAQKNTPLICQELDFLWLVLDNIDTLRMKWR